MYPGTGTLILFFFLLLPDHVRPLVVVVAAIIVVADVNVVAGGHLVLGVPRPLHRVLRHAPPLSSRDVLVDGDLYNVQFLDGTCSEMYNGCDSTSDFTFQTLAAATLASSALSD